MKLDIIIGMGDGLTVPFALAAGVSAVAASTDTVLIIGVAGTALGAIILALGGYLTNKKEASNNSNMADIYRNLGLSEAVADVEKENKDWDAHTMKAELQPTNAAASALVIWLSYVMGACIPLSPYFFMDTPLEALRFSAILTLSVLFIFSYFKSRLTGLHPWLGAFQGTITAAIAAGAAFGVARLFFL